ncbi:cyclin-dependent kinase inhibitor 3 family protein [Pseudomonadota bacterium]
MTRTSDTHPLRIDSLQVPGYAGRIGLTFCPGKKQSHAMTGEWERDLQADLHELQAWGANTLVTLMEMHELRDLEVEDLGSKAVRVGLDWLHLPILDMSIPDETFEAKWQAEGPGLHDLLESGGRLVLHCKGGLGRTGTIAARMLVESGMAPGDAIAAVRNARPGAIETRGQERYLLRLHRT